MVASWVGGEEGGWAVAIEGGWAVAIEGGWAVAIAAEEGETLAILGGEGRGGYCNGEWEAAAADDDEASCSLDVAFVLSL